MGFAFGKTGGPQISQMSQKKTWLICDISVICGPILSLLCANFLFQYSCLLPGYNTPLFF